MIPCFLKSLGSYNQTKPKPRKTTENTTTTSKQQSVMKNDVESQQFKSAEPQTSYNSNCLDLGEMLLPYECRFSKARVLTPSCFSNRDKQGQSLPCFTSAGSDRKIYFPFTSRTVFNNKMFFGFFSEMLNSRELVWKRWLMVAARNGLQRELPSAADDFPGAGTALLGARSGDVLAVSSLLVEN